MEKLNSWLTIDTDSDFSIYNLPYGIFSDSFSSPRAGVAIGDSIIDLVLLNESGLIDDLAFDSKVFNQGCLNDFISLGKEKHLALRKRLIELLTNKDAGLAEKEADILTDRLSVKMHLPIKVGDYTDFYSSIEHATNVGMMFRDPENALLPNWKHLPVGYHGRASSICVSGTPIIRPKGQQLPKDATQPVYGPCKLLDLELEMAFVIGKETQMGESISTKDAEEYIFGMMLFNDWSARDIQKWEYIPLGPFLGKSFASTLSPWIVTMEALAPFRLEGPLQEPEVLDYLKYEGLRNYDINLFVDLIPEGGEPNTISESNFKYMYWNMTQQLAHHTVNGCNVKVGDLMASGTISGKDKGSYGSLLEISWAGKYEIPLNNGETRKFLKDGDSIDIRGFAQKDGIKVGFGNCRGKIHPAT